MTDIKALERHFERIDAIAKARGLSPCERGESDGTPALKVSERTFVRLLDAKTLALHCPLDQKVLLMEISPEIYFETDDQVGNDTVLIRLDAIDDEELALRLEDGWRFRVAENTETARKE